LICDYANDGQWITRRYESSTLSAPSGPGPPQVGVLTVVPLAADRLAAKAGDVQSIILIKKANAVVGRWG
jgi:hypothetical protein